MSGPSAKPAPSGTKRPEGEARLGRWRTMIAPVSLLVAALLFAAPVSGLHHRVAIALGGDVVLAPAPGGNGFGLLRWEMDGLPRRSRFLLELNTDTLRL